MRYVNVDITTVAEWEKAGIDLKSLSEKYRMLCFFSENPPINPLSHNDFLRCKKITNQYTTANLHAIFLNTPADQYGNTMIHFTAMLGNIFALQAIMKISKVALLQRNNRGYHLAHFAATYQDASVLNWIFNDPALSVLLTEPARNKILPMHIAANSGVIENFYFFVRYYSKTLNEKTQESFSQTVLDHALFSQNPHMVANVAEELEIQNGQANFRRSAWRKEEMHTLCDAIALSDRLLYAKIPDHTSCALYDPHQNSHNIDENRQRLHSISDASENQIKNRDMICIGLVVLARGVDQHRVNSNSIKETSAKICPDVFWYIFEFLNTGRTMEKIIVKYGFRSHDALFKPVYPLRVKRLQPTEEDNNLMALF